MKALCEFVDQFFIVELLLSSCLSWELREAKLSVTLFQKLVIVVSAIAGALFFMAAHIVCAMEHVVVRVS